MDKRTLLLFSYTLSCTVLLGQTTTVPLGSPTYQYLDRLEIKCGKLIEGYHSCNKPVDRYGIVEFNAYLDTGSTCELSDVDIENIDYVYRDNMEWSEKGRTPSKRPIFNVFYKTPANFLQVDIPKFQLVANPVAQIRGGYDMDSRSGNDFKLQNTKGFEMRGQVDDVFGFYTFFTSEQTFFPGYATDMINEFQAVPKAGYYKNFKTGGYDYFRAKGYVTVRPTKHVNFQFGYDNNFIGDGYRSMFLSDVGNDYLFLKVNTRIWRFNYQNIFAELAREYPHNRDTLLPKKYMAIHHLTFNATRWLRLGIFESVVFARENTFELQYLNPIIFYRAVEQALGSPDNAFIGFDFRANFARHFSIYGQFLLDEMNFAKEFDFGNKDNGKGFFYELTHPQKWWATKFSSQLGMKYIDAFGIKNLDLQLEANMARPYTYAHYNLQTAYTHYNQPLAHPLGANFTELVSIINFQPIQKLTINAKYIHAKYGEDNDSTNYGKNIFANYGNREYEYGNYTGQGIQAKMNILELLISYMPFHNVNVDVNYVMRKVNSEDDARDRNTNYVNMAVRINIPYRTVDY